MPTILTNKLQDSIFLRLNKYNQRGKIKHYGEFCVVLYSKNLNEDFSPILDEIGDEYFVENTESETRRIFKFNNKEEAKKLYNKICDLRPRANRRNRNRNRNQGRIRMNYIQTDDRYDVAFSNDVLRELQEQFQTYMARSEEYLNATYNSRPVDNALGSLPDFCREEILNLTINEESQLQKQLWLKRNLHNYMDCENPNNRVRFSEIANWVVCNWGGISSYQNLDRDLPIISGQHPLRNSDPIASISKILSFMFPKEKFVYDSRAVFSINYFLLRAYKELGVDEREYKFFFSPSGQNKITQRARTLLTKYPNNFICLKDSYRIYCDIIKDCLMSGSEEPYKGEMLLFSIASSPRGNAGRNLHYIYDEFIV